MDTLFRGSLPPEVTSWLDRREALGLDGHDEVWEGVLHVTPHAHGRHAIVGAAILIALAPWAKAAGLVTAAEFHLGREGNFRVPDGGWFLDPDVGLYLNTAVVVLEVLSPDDETFNKFPYYAQLGVREVIVADPDKQTVECWASRDGANFVPTDSSVELGVSMADLHREIDWP